MFWKRNSAVIDRQEPEKKLRIVAALFVLEGVTTLLRMAGKLAMGRINIEFGILAFWIAGGLRRKDVRWLKWAKFFTWIDLIAIDAIAAISTLNDLDPTLTIGPYTITPPRTALMLYFALIGATSLWKLHVLNRSSVDALFVEDGVHLLRQDPDKERPTIGEPATWPAGLQQLAGKHRQQESKTDPNPRR